MSHDSDAEDRLHTAVQMTASLVPHVGGVIAALADYERDRYYKRAQETADRIALQSSQELLDRAMHDERRSVLIVQAVFAAGASGFEEKRRALADAVAAHVVDGDAELDDGELLVAALMAIERPHATLLARICGAESSIDWQPTSSPHPRTRVKVPADLLEPYAALGVLRQIGAVAEVEELFGPQRVGTTLNAGSRSGRRGDLPVSYNVDVTRLGVELYRLLAASRS